MVGDWGRTAIAAPSTSRRGQATVIVPPSQLGLATLNKQPMILDAGLHFIYSPGFEWKRGVSVNVVVDSKKRDNKA